MKQENEVSKFIKKLGIETDPLGRVKIDVGVLEKIKPDLLQYYLLRMTGLLD